VVVSCESSTLKVANQGKTEEIDGFDIILEDTILFPEGGGQPDDRGTINSVPVLRVRRKGRKAIHFTPDPFIPGAHVHLCVDWERRFDHMQQHSGQHLITAIADHLFKFATTSWNLGLQDSYIELDTPSISAEEMREIEQVVNQKIRQGLAVSVRVYEEGAPELRMARTRGLPEDYHGPVRIVTIEGVESNMCCGTHVRSLAHLQSIKLTFAEKGKKNKTNLHFVAGSRVLEYLGACLEKDKALTGLLKCGVEKHVELVDKLQKSLKLSQKNELNLIRDLALLEVQKFKLLEPRPSLLSLHRREEIPDFMSIIVNEINDVEVTIFITMGDENSSGQMCLAGKPQLVADLAPKLSLILGGKGACKGNKFQGKVTNMSKRSSAEKLIQDTLNRLRDEEEVISALNQEKLC